MSLRIRATKPEFWRSKTIADALTWEQRLVLKALEAYVDDNGVGKDDIELIVSEVFPRDILRNPQETLRRVSEAISAIHKADLIARYEVDGEPLLYIDKWKDIQRVEKPNRGRFPRPDGTLEYSEPVSRESYRKSPEGLPPVTGEQGNRGTGEQGGGAAVTYVTTDRPRGKSATPPPPLGNGDINNPRCPQHSKIGADDRGPNCRNCRRHREYLETQPAREAAATKQAAVNSKQLAKDCPDCDEFGWLLDTEPAKRCTHGRATA